MKALKHSQVAKGCLRPKESKSSNFQDDIDFGFKPRIHANNRTRMGIRSTLLMVALTAILFFPCIMFIFRVNADFHINLTSEIAWIAVGIVFGIPASAWVTQRQLNNLAKTGESSTTLKSLLIVLGTAVVAVAIFLEVFFGDMSGEIKTGVVNAVNACGMAVFSTRSALMVLWEKRNRRTILQDNYGFYISTREPLNQVADQSVPNRIVQDDEKMKLH